MSTFKTDLLLRALAPAQVEQFKSDVQLYMLLSPLMYESDLFGTIEVPVGFVTDFASIPRLAWAWMSPEDPVILYASVVHDFLYKTLGVLPNKTLVREECDRVLREAMACCGARWDQQQIVFSAVRLGGGSHWK